jgi:hypothetical protein
MADRPEHRNARSDEEKVTFYIECSVIVDGALEKEVVLYSFSELNAFITEEALAAIDGLPTEIYALFHDHEPMMFCNCLSYLQDHGPHCSFNMDREPEHDSQSP